MPELPEVQTTVDGINAVAKNLSITDVWTDYRSVFHAKKNNIKNPEYFSHFKKDVVGAKIKNASRKGKNILIHLSNGNTILIHMKMTGHLMYGKYEYKIKEKEWSPLAKDGPLRDPYNKHLHLVFSLSNKHHLAFSDLRKFAKVFVFKTPEEHAVLDLMHLGPDPLTISFTKFQNAILKKPKSKIKQVLMNQEILAGIGNIYSDEMLFAAGIHPLSHPQKIPAPLMKKLFTFSKKVLHRGIDFGGDSDSDYRNIYGERGEFQNKHNVYRKTGKKCPKKDGGTIVRKVIAGRSGHFCPVHQKLYI